MLALILTRLEHHTTSFRFLEVPPQEHDTIQLDTATERDSLGTLYLYDACDPLRYCLIPSMPPDNTMPPGEPVPGLSISTMPADLWDKT